MRNFMNRSNRLRRNSYRIVAAVTLAAVIGLAAGPVLADNDDWNRVVATIIMANRTTATETTIAATAGIARTTTTAAVDTSTRRRQWSMHPMRRLRSISYSRFTFASSRPSRVFRGGRAREGAAPAGAIAALEGGVTWKPY